LKNLQFFSTKISKFPNFWVGNKNTDNDSVVDEGTIAISAVHPGTGWMGGQKSTFSFWIDQ
jgi:hypothetical protein